MHARAHVSPLNHKVSMITCNLQGTHAPIRIYTQVAACPTHPYVCPSIEDAVLNRDGRYA